MFLIPEGKILILVEFQGNDVMRAREQIHSTLRILEQVVNLSSERYAFVIPIQREMKKFRNDFGVKLIVKNGWCSFNLANRKVQ